MPETALATAAARDLTILELAEHAAKSGYFADARQAAQAVIKIQYGRELGIPPVTAIMGVHIIQGKPTPSAGLIAACIRRHPRYDYRVKRLDDTACILEFIDGGKLAGLSDFTIEQAKRAGAFDSNGATWTKFPRNMLFARALTNGARWFCPDVFGGAVYSPEEMGAVVDEEGDIIDATPAESFIPLRAQDPEPDPGPRSVTGKLLMRYGQILTEARHAGAITEAELQDYILPSQARDPYIIAKGKELGEKIKQARASADQPAARSESGAPPSPPARPLELADVARSELWAENRRLVTKAAELGVLAVPTLSTRAATDVIAQANESIRLSIKAIEDELVVEPDEQESLV